jgi:hypothetical protein
VETRSLWRASRAGMSRRFRQTSRGRRSQRCCGIQFAAERTTGSQRMVGRSSYRLRLCLTYKQKTWTPESESGVSNFPSPGTEDRPSAASSAYPLPQAFGGDSSRPCKHESRQGTEGVRARFDNQFHAIRLLQDGASGGGSVSLDALSIGMRRMNNSWCS